MKSSVRTIALTAAWLGVIALLCGVMNTLSIREQRLSVELLHKSIVGLEKRQMALSIDMLRLVGKELRRRDDASKPWWEAHDYWEAHPRNPLWKGTGVFSAGTPVPRLWLGDDDCTEEGQP